MSRRASWIRWTRIGTASLSLCLAGASLAAADDAVAADALAALTAPAESTKLSLEQAVAMALERQPAVSAARATRNGAIAQRDAAYSRLAKLSGLQIHVRRKQADIGVAIAQAGLDQAELDTTNAVTRTYLTAIYASEQVKVATDSADRFRSVHKVAEEMVKSGTSKDTTTADVERIGTYRLLAESKQAEAISGIARAKAALREAIGLPSDYPLDLGDDQLTHKPIKVSCDCAVKLGLQHRPELVQALLFADLTCLEIDAQKLTMHCKAQTFAATGDIHSKVLPATVINGDYRPGPVGPEMPTYLAGCRSQRVARAGHLYDHAAAAAEKAKGLIALEIEETCLRLHEQASQVRILSQAARQADKLAKDAERGFRADQVKADQMLMSQVIEAQSRAQLNEATYKYAVAMANLHRVTGGHFWECVEKE